MADVYSSLHFARGATGDGPRITAEARGNFARVTFAEGETRVDITDRSAEELAAFLYAAAREVIRAQHVDENMLREEYGK